MTWSTAGEGVSVVESGDRIFVQRACATPTALLQALIERGDELRDVEIVHLHTYGPTPYTDDKWAGHFSLRALFVAENTRAAVNAGRASYTPIFFSDVPALLARGNELAVDVAFIQVSPPGAAVTTSRAHVHYVVTEYGIAALHGRDLAERARSLIAIAAPQFREQLERAASALHLI